MVAKTFEEMVADAKEQCKTKPVNNLILTLDVQVFLPLKL
jgi:hypothetical protein